MTTTHQINSALRLLDGARRGRARVDAWTENGIGHEQGLVARPVRGLPLHFLELLVQGWSLRFAPFTCDTGQPFLELPLLCVTWKAAVERNGRRFRVADAGVERVTAALARMPDAALFVDAGEEVAAGWLLDEPITEAAEARAALVALARRLGGVEPPPLAKLTLPLAGPARNSLVRTRTAIFRVDASRRHSLNQILKGEGNVDITTRTGRASRSGRRSAEAVGA